MASHHNAAAGASIKISRKASSLTDDDDADAKGETSRHRRKICKESGAGAGAGAGDACGGHAQTAAHGSSAGEADYIYLSDDDDGGAGDACGGHAQAAAHGSSVGKADYIYLSSDDEEGGAGEEEEEEEYIYEYDDDDGGELEGGGAEQQAQDDSSSPPTAAAAMDREEQRYVVLTEDDIRARQDSDTAKVAEVLSIPSGFAAVLLRHFKWRVGRVQEEWFTDDARVRAAVGLPTEPQQLVPASRGGVGQRQICGVCFDDYPAARTAAAACREHFYCDECWQGYVRAAVADGPRCLELRCPDPSCSAPVVRELVDDVLSGSADADDGARYRRFWLRSYVEESGDKLRWCGGAGCTRALEFLGDTTVATDVFCECGHGVCWSCGEEAHRPVSCATVRAWLVKNSSDSAETANWVVAHTKPCPKCARPIEKNQGCNHMRCSPPCGHHFCWLCLQPAGGANHYACNDARRAAVHPNANDYIMDMAAAAGAAPLPPTAAAAAAHVTTTAAFMEEQLKRRRARAALERYMHHYERWVSNRLALESVLRDTALLERGGELERMARAADVATTELAFVGEAYREVAHGRRVLRWAHAYGYFLDPDRDGAKRALFDDLQNQANRWLECLHAAAELERKDLFGDGGGGKGKKKVAVAQVVVGSVENEAFRAYRQVVANLTGVTRKFLGNLVKAFENDLPEVVAPAAAAVNPNPVKYSSVRDRLAGVM